MKTTGFIKEHEVKILDDVVNYTNDESPDVAVDKLLVDKIIKYLEDGISIFSMTLGVTDNDGKVIGQYEIFTDGYWIWPMYYSYYLKSKKISKINQAFLNHMKSTSFAIANLSWEKNKEAKKYFWDLLMSNNQDVKA